jgi:putative ABC transport system permease protein
VLVFALLVGMSTTLIFGLAPALQVGRRDLSDALRDCVKGPGGRSVRTGVHHAVIVCEVAFSLTILIAAGMFMRSFVALTQVKLGLRPDHVLAARIPLSPDRYKTASQVAGFFQPLLARLKSMPGVAYATETSAIPPYGGIRSAVQVSGKVHTENWPSIFQLCSEDYFSVLRIELMQGRTFTESEVNDARKLAVINQTFQSQYLGTGNPIGARIHLDELNKFPDAVTDPWFEVIGVVADAKNHGLQDPVVPEAWLPYTVTGSAGRGILVRTVKDPAMMVNAVRREIWRTDHNVAMAFAETLENFLNIFSYGQPRFGLLLVSIFAVIGLILVATGVYSVIAYATARRTHEIGIRMALGAASGDVQKLVVRTGLRLVAAGIAVGLLASLGLSRMIAKELWGVSPYDPLTLAAVPALLLFVALLACWIPARRAAGVDPLVALRHE